MTWDTLNKAFILTCFKSVHLKKKLCCINTRHKIDFQKIVFVFKTLKKTRALNFLLS